ncbi:MAG: hypothetical protein JNK04_24630, partial [Myxococcales bacterium]|nr:hypothetical protein [Myxococcales bacterium]
MSDEKKGKGPGGTDEMTPIRDGSPDAVSSDQRPTQLKPDGKIQLGGAAAEDAAA